MAVLNLKNSLKVMGSPFDLPTGFWVEKDGDTFTLGIETAVKEETGDFIALNIPEAGAVVDKGEAVVTINGTQNDVEVVLPFACVISEVNQDLVELAHLSADQDWVVKFERYHFE